MTLRCLVLASGRGSNFEALLRASAGADAPYTLTGLVTDRPATGAQALAEAAGVPQHCLPFKAFPSRASFDQALAETLMTEAPDLVLCAGFMRVLGPAFFAHCPLPLVNIHPALLPAHRGLHTHRRVLEAGDPFHGATVHWLTPALDSGPTIAQARLPVLPGEGEAALAARVLRLEHALYPQALAHLAAHRLAPPAPLELLWDGEALTPWG